MQVYKMAGIPGILALGILLSLLKVTAVETAEAQFSPFSQFSNFPTMPPFPTMPSVQPQTAIPGPVVTQSIPVTQEFIGSPGLVTPAPIQPQFVPVTPATMLPLGSIPATSGIPGAPTPLFELSTSPPITITPTTFLPTFAPPVQQGIAFAATAPISPNTVPLEFLQTTACPGCATSPQVVFVTTQPSMGSGSPVFEGAQSANMPQVVVTTQPSVHSSGPVFAPTQPFITTAPVFAPTQPGVVTSVPVATTQQVTFGSAMPVFVTSQPGAESTVPGFVTTQPSSASTPFVVTTQPTLTPVTQPPECQTKEGRAGICISPVFCMDTVGNRTTPCMAGQTLGVCCPRMIKPEETKVSIPNQVITTSRVAFINKDEYEHKKAVEHKLFQMGIQLPEATSAESLMQGFHQTSESALRISQAFQEQQISSLSRGRAMIPTSACPPPPPCSKMQIKYRSYDGSCNNLQHPEFGMAVRSFRRLLPAKYDDGKNSPRIHGVDGSLLPPSRKIVTTAFQDKDNPHPAVSLMFMQWGQVLGHDSSLSAISKGKSGSSITCCSEAVMTDQSLRHPSCFAIDIPADDPFYKQFNVHCMEFVRSLAGPTHDCKPGPREQINQVTSFIDGSLIYSSSEKDAKNLRTFQGGLLKTTRWNKVDLLPFDPEASCSKKKKNLFCYKAGDFRINMTPDLTSVQTIFLREHNRLARALSARNPTWDDERIFLEARRIVGAELQHITFNEYLPILLGPDLIRQFKLSLERTGFSSSYNSSIDSTLMNEFSTAAYRLGHSQIAWDSEVYDKNQQRVTSYPLRDEFFRPYKLQMPGHMDMYLRGLCRQSVQRFDHFITKEITDHLFQVGRAFGLDLMSFDIQRGRDHGLRPYNDYRVTCGLPRIKGWDDLTNYLRPETIEPLKSLYRSVDDIDLFVGGMLERSLKKANMGPTFACIVSEQFRRLKLADRFWYENGNLPNSFTPGQLHEIRKVKLSKVLCENSDGIKLLQTEAFIKPSKWNPQVPCEHIPSMDLSAWVGA